MEGIKKKETAARQCNASKYKVRKGGAGSTALAFDLFRKTGLDSTRLKRGSVSIVCWIGNRPGDVIDCIIDR
jgi:hypothetical protein